MQSEIGGGIIAAGHPDPAGCVNLCGPNAYLHLDIIFAVAEVALRLHGAR